MAQRLRWSRLVLLALDRLHRGARLHASAGKSDQDEVAGGDVKTDRVDSEVIAHFTWMDYLPTCYVPSKEMRELRNLLRHRAFRTKISTALKNRTWSEFRKRDIKLETSLGTKTLDVLSCCNVEVLAEPLRQPAQAEDVPGDPALAQPQRLCVIDNFLISSELCSDIELCLSRLDSACWSFTPHSWMSIASSIIYKWEHLTFG